MDFLACSRLSITRRRRRSKSTFFQRSASTSPRRIPVESATSTGQYTLVCAIARRAASIARPSTLTWCGAQPLAVVYARRRPGCGSTVAALTARESADLKMRWDMATALWREAAILASCRRLRDRCKGLECGSAKSLVSSISPIAGIRKVWTISLYRSDVFGETRWLNDSAETDWEGQLWYSPS
jgi:hypothetical protein